MEKKVSIIIPCYNAGKYIDQCLDSLVNQTIGTDQMDIIIIDDASTDDSRSHILKYRERYPDSIHLISNTINSGQAVARNAGMDYVKTDYLAFVDADDWVEPELYEKMLEPAERYQCDLVGCAYIEHVGQQVHVRRPDLPEKLYILHDAGERTRLLHQHQGQGGIGRSLYRAQYLREHAIRFKDFRKYEDNYWVGLIRYTFQTYYPLQFPGYHYIRQENSNSYSRNDPAHFDRLIVEMEKLQYFQNTGVFDQYYKDVRDCFIQKFYENTLHIIFCQFDYFPLEQVEVVQEVVKEVFPDYLEYYKIRRKENYLSSVITVAFTFPMETWLKYKEAYLALLAGGTEALWGIHLQMEEKLSLDMKTDGGEG